MRISSTVAAAFSFLSIVSAADFNIVVGKDNTNRFDPPSISDVKVGDKLHFRFVSKSHSVTQSTFDLPCTSKTDGVDSGFFPVDAGATAFPEWSISINNVTAPLWFYCARVPHCTASGMVFAINPTADKTFDEFKAKAMGTTATTFTTSSSTTPTPTSAARRQSMQKMSAVLTGVAVLAVFSL